MENKEQALKDLKKILEQGKRKVYCFCRHVSNSGMMRRISFFSIVNNEPILLDWYIERADIGYKKDKNNAGLRIIGCGMDMGFSVVYNIGGAVYSNGDTKPETDSGYLLKHIWL